MATQKTLFLTRDQKQASLDAAVLVGVHTARTARTVKSLIWAIDTAPECSRVRELMAARMNVSASTVVRAVRLAESLGWLETTSVPGDANTYRINWSAIQNACPDQMTPVAKFCYPCQSFATGVKTMTPVSKPIVESETNETQRVEETENERPEICDAGARAMDEWMDGCNDSLESQNNSSIHSSSQTTTIERAPTTVIRPERGAAGPGGWPEAITAQTLRQPAQVDRLFWFAEGRGWVDAAERLEFHALAACMGRIAGGKVPIAKIGGRFTVRVKEKVWKQTDWAEATSADWAAARGAISRLDNPPAEPTPPVVPETAEKPPPEERTASVQQTIDFEARRKLGEQTRELLARRIRGS